MKPIFAKTRPKELRMSLNTVSQSLALLGFSPIISDQESIVLAE
jgi:hypothetical protein